MEQFDPRTRSWTVVVPFLMILSACDGIDMAPRAEFGDTVDSNRTNEDGGSVTQPPISGVGGDGRLSQGGNGGTRHTGGSGGSSGTGVDSGAGGSAGSPQGGSGGAGGDTGGTGGIGGDPEAGQGGMGGEGGTAGEPQGGVGGEAGTAGVGGESGEGGVGGEGGSAGTGEAGVGGDSGAGGAGEGGAGGMGGNEGCSSDQKLCNDICVSLGNPAYGCEPESCTTTNVQFEEAHCGACGNACNSGETCQQGVCEEPEALECTSYVRSAIFDQFELDGDDYVPHVGGAWSASSGDTFISAGITGRAVVAHCTGVSCVQEDLPGNEFVGGVWGSSLSNIWVAGRGNSGTEGMLFRRNSNGTWSDDQSKPIARQFTDVWGSNASNVYALGWIPGQYKVWRKSGSSWVDLDMPNPWINGECFSIWGLDDENLFVPCEQLDEEDATRPVKGYLLYWNGNSWSQIPTMPNIASLRGIHGTSLDDLWLTGLTSERDGALYHITNLMSSWDSYVDGETNLMRTVWSPKYGAALAAGNVPTGGMRLTQIDEVTLPTTNMIDDSAYSPIKIWAVPGTDVVHFVHNSFQHAGFYTAHCN